MASYVYVYACHCNILMLLGKVSPAFVTRSCLKFKRGFMA